ncbi:zinc finger CCCH domain-containing protein 13-like [Bolinopsis microptera]|uniref:zinc finger CCCH domain-containing protein 13-like n=1 Tax=Bolinopsis microptera TaxID=2820187 RepID=UPI00307A92A2
MESDEQIESKPNKTEKSSEKSGRSRRKSKDGRSRTRSEHSRRTRKSAEDYTNQGTRSRHESEPDKSSRRSKSKRSRRSDSKNERKMIVPEEEADRSHKSRENLTKSHRSEHYVRNSDRLHESERSKSRKRSERSHRPKSKDESGGVENSERSKKSKERREQSGTSKSKERSEGPHKSRSKMESSDKSRSKRHSDKERESKNNTEKRSRRSSKSKEASSKENKSAAVKHRSVKQSSDHFSKDDGGKISERDRDSKRKHGVPRGGKQRKINPEDATEAERRENIYDEEEKTASEDELTKTPSLKVLNTKGLKPTKQAEVIPLKMEIDLNTINLLKREEETRSPDTQYALQRRKLLQDKHLVLPESTENTIFKRFEAALHQDDIPTYKVTKIETKPGDPNLSNTMNRVKVRYHNMLTPPKRERERERDITQPTVEQITGLIPVREEPEPRDLSDRSYEFQYVKPDLITPELKSQNTSDLTKKKKFKKSTDDFDKKLKELQESDAKKIEPLDSPKPTPDAPTPLQENKEVATDAVTLTVQNLEITNEELNKYRQQIINLPAVEVQPPVTEMSENKVSERNKGKPKKKQREEKKKQREDVDEKVSRLERRVLKNWDQDSVTLYSQSSESLCLTDTKEIDFEEMMKQDFDLERSVSIRIDRPKEVVDEEENETEISVAYKSDQSELPREKEATSQLDADETVEDSKTEESKNMIEVSPDQPTKVNSEQEDVSDIDYMNVMRLDFLGADTMENDNKLNVYSSGSSHVTDRSEASGVEEIDSLEERLLIGLKSGEVFDHKGFLKRNISGAKDGKTFTVEPYVKPTPPPMTNLKKPLQYESVLIEVPLNTKSLEEEGAWERFKQRVKDMIWSDMEEGSRQPKCIRMVRYRENEEDELDLEPPTHTYVESIGGEEYEFDSDASDSLDELDIKLFHFDKILQQNWAKGSRLNSNKWIKRIAEDELENTRESPDFMTKRLENRGVINPPIYSHILEEDIASPLDSVDNMILSVDRNLKVKWYAEQLIADESGMHKEELTDGLVSLLRKTGQNDMNISRIVSSKGRLRQYLEKELDSPLLEKDIRKIEFLLGDTQREPEKSWKKLEKLQKTGEKGET